MKNISLNLRLLLLLFLLMTGCGKEFLEPYDELVLDVPDFYSELSATSISGMTSNMYSIDWFGQLDKATTCLQEIYCGNAWTADGAYIPFFDGTLNSNFGQLALIWDGNYGIIKDCNANINGFYVSLQEGQSLKEKMDTIPELKTAINTTIGELRFFRAICYFNLVRWWGPVPLIYDNIYQMANPESLKPVVEEDIYDFIIRDLEDAIAKLPETRNTAQSHKLSQVSAKALLAKVYLTKAGMPFGTDADFNQAATLANDVITNPGGYALMNTYHENFLPIYAQTNFPEECLYGWSWSITALWANWGYNNTLQSYYANQHFTQSWDGWSAVTPSVDLRESFEEGDLRVYSTIMEQGSKYPEFWTEYTFPGETEPGYVYYDGSAHYGGPTGTAMTVRKHLAGRDNSADGRLIGEMHTEVYTPIIRMADMYLTYAEAILGKSASTSDGQALIYFNTIRERAGLPDKTSITYTDIWNERRHEFAFEFCNTNDLFRYHNLYPGEAINMLLSQKRGMYTCETEAFTIDGVPQEFPEGTPLTVVTSKTYNDFKVPSVTEAYFKLPYPIGEVNGNVYINESPMRFDFDNYQ